MSRVVSPPVSEFSKLRQPLTAGERIVFDFFNTYLAPEWEIYLQPHLNGLRPDFVLLNPKVGVAVYEVKDWNLNAMNYYMHCDHVRPPQLMGQKDGISFSLQKENPIEKVIRYKKEIHGLYCPRLKQNKGFGVITAGVIFPFADDGQLKMLFDESLKYHGIKKYNNIYPIVGQEALASGKSWRVLPNADKHSNEIYEELAKDLRRWLVEPDVSAEQREPLVLDANQKALATTRTESGYRRVRGPAGSGKSLVLAARAAELLKEGKTVLVVTFNITLINYLMDLAVRWPGATGKTRQDVTWLNFHAWCKRVCDDLAEGSLYDDLWKQHSVNEVMLYELANLVSKLLDSDIEEFLPRYDAVLVDEGQDFLPGWWNALRKVCKPGGEMLLAADVTQDIYGTASAWTDEAMTGAGFKGAWAELDVSYRLPEKLVDLVIDFARKFLPAGLVNEPQKMDRGLGLEATHLRWVQCSAGSAVSVCFDEIMRLFSGVEYEGVAMADTTLLCDSKEIGMKIASSLEQKNINVIHTFDTDEKESRRQKVGFYKGDARVKATTLHSFKGWESRLLVIYISGELTLQKKALFYTGLTRLKHHVDGSFLTVVSSSEALSEYGKTWPDYAESCTNKSFFN